MPADDLVWCDPPERGGRSKKDTLELVQDLQLLKERPGDWCHVRTFDSVNGAGRMRTTLGKRKDMAGFQFTVRRLAVSTSGLWARYTNGDSP